MSNGSPGLRSPGQSGTPHQSVDGQRDCRRNEGSWHRDPDFATACISAAQKGGFQPHRFRYWLTEVPDPHRDEKIGEGCTLYLSAVERAKQGERTISLDELTGVQALESRAAFLQNPTHRVVFHYTPKHASWMNQVEIWLSILVRKLLKRGHFLSLDDLRDQILAFITYYNRAMAKPIKWTYTGLS